MATPVTATELKKELAIMEPTQIVAREGENPEMEKKADTFVEGLLKARHENHEEREGAKASVDQLALDLQKEAARQSEMLKQPIRALSERSKDGGEVANSLIDLKMQVEELDPNKVDLEPGWFTRMLGRLPGIGSPLKRYFTKYESAQTVIAAIVRSLELGRDTLKRDNVTLKEDQKRMREMTHKLSEAVKLAQMIDQKLEYKLSREISPTDPKAAFVKEELLFVLRQRVMDLQQQLAVNLQGVLATEMIIRNNNELARGVDRALGVTINALQVAVTVALALANQKLVLDKVTQLNATTSNLIAGTAQRLRTQGVEIHKQAASTMLDVNALKSAFNDIKMAMHEISDFRQKALPQMASTIVEMDKLAADAEASVKKMEEGNKAKPTIVIDVSPT